MRGTVLPDPVGVALAPSLHTLPVDAVLHTLPAPPSDHLCSATPPLHRHDPARAIQLCASPQVCSKAHLPPSDPGATTASWQLANVCAPGLASQHDSLRRVGSDHSGFTFELTGGRVKVEALRCTPALRGVPAAHAPPRAPAPATPHFDLRSVTLHPCHSLSCHRRAMAAAPDGNGADKAITAGEEWWDWMCCTHVLRRYPALRQLDHPVGNHLPASIAQCTLTRHTRAGSSPFTCAAAGRRVSWSSSVRVAV